MDIHELRDEQGEVIHAFATASFPLPSDHWIYKNPVRPAAIGGDHSELTRAFRMQVREALKYTIQVCTSRGKDPDFDPDAMWMTLDTTLFGDFDVPSHLTQQE